MLGLSFTSHTVYKPPEMEKEQAQRETLGIGEEVRAIPKQFPQRLQVCPLGNKSSQAVLYIGITILMRNLLGPLNSYRKGKKCKLTNDSVNLTISHEIIEGSKSLAHLVRRFHKKNLAKDA